MARNYSHTKRTAQIMFPSLIFPLLSPTPLTKLTLRLSLRSFLSVDSHKHTLSKEPHVDRRRTPNTNSQRLRLPFNQVHIPSLFSSFPSFYFFRSLSNLRFYLGLSSIFLSLGISCIWGCEIMDILVLLCWVWA